LILSGCAGERRKDVGTRRRPRRQMHALWVLCRAHALIYLFGDEGRKWCHKERARSKRRPKRREGRLISVARTVADAAHIPLRKVLYEARDGARCVVEPVGIEGCRRPPHRLCYASTHPPVERGRL